MVAKLVFTCAATFTRLSLHCFYYRLIADTGKSWFKWCIHLNVIYTVGILVSFMYVNTHTETLEVSNGQLNLHRFIAIFQCNPVSDYWVVGSPAGSCMDEGIATLVCGIINCVADLATTVTPIPLILGVSNNGSPLRLTLMQRSSKCHAVSVML